MVQKTNQFDDPQRPAAAVEPSEIAEQVCEWVSSLSEREQRLEEHLAQNGSMFERIEERLRELNDKIASLIELNVPGEAETAPDESASTGSESFLSGWQEQREKMLKALASEADELEAAERAREATSQAGSAFAASEAPSARDHESSLLAHASQQDLLEIEALKQQLQEALRETEIELSIQRAKLSQEKQRLEEMESALNQREKAMLRKAATSGSGKGDGIVGRLRGMLQMPPEDNRGE